MRKRRVSSIKLELLNKSKESALTAIQIFNNPNILFKAESYIVLMIISWTYLLHAYYKDKKIDYRYYNKIGKRKQYDTTKRGAYKYWELERCLDETKSPIDSNTKNNLKFLIGLRHEIEHQMTTRIDDMLSARFQACCLNYNDYLQQLFGEKHAISKNLSFSLQLSSISTEQKTLLEEYPNLPEHIHSYICNFDEALNEAEYSNPRYSFRVLFVQKTANRKGQADKVIEFVKEGSELAEKVNKEYALIKETEKPKYLPKQIVEKMNQEGFKRFTMHKHTQLWQNMEAKKADKHYGTLVANKTWLWYERWIEEVRNHCQNNKNDYM